MKCIIQEDGTAIIPIDPDGLPSCVGELPLALYKPEDRPEHLKHAVFSRILQDGSWVQKIEMVHNPVLDKKGEKTTAKISVRTCKNTYEAYITGYIAKLIADDIVFSQAAN